jgi:xanthine dehydrogenase accessory factor
MPSFYEQLLDALRAGERFALGTVVHTQGSTPQKKGARALFFPNGRITGTLGGGCLEAEARRRALLALRKGDPFHFTVQLDNDFGWDDGLICGGTATVLIEPEAGHHRAAVSALVEAERAGKRSVLAVVVDAEEVKPGETLLFRRGESPLGADLPSSLHAALAAHAEALLESPWQEPQTVQLPNGVGRAYFEPHYPLPALLIIGGGHVGAALAHFASRLDFAVAVLDDRPSLVTPDRFPEAKHLLVEEITAGLRGFPLGPESFVVIVTRGHQHDAEALRETVASPAAYVGMIGSRRKVHVIFQGLLEEGLATPEQLRRVRAPLGLEIGARSVDEIALSIAAELVAVRAKIRAGADPYTLWPEGESDPPISALRSPKSIDFGF